MADALGFTANSVAATGEVPDEGVPGGDQQGGSTGPVARPAASAARPEETRPGARREAGVDAEQLLEMLARAPHQFDFFQVLRRLECAFRDRPRLGEASRPAQDPIRLGQEPSLGFAPTALSRLRPGEKGGPPWLLVHFMGLLGPNGPLPLHLTEYVRDRVRNSNDPTMMRFLDLFHHRMLTLFYRAWAKAQPTVSHDRPDSDRFQMYIAALNGLAARVFRNADTVPDSAKLFYAGLLGGQTRHASGLGAIIGEFFGMPVQIEEFVGDWLELPDRNRWALGRREPAGTLGLSTTLGARAWSRQQKFRIILGPLDRGQFRRMLPGGTSLPRLKDLVRGYVGDELRWDVRLMLHDRVDDSLKLGRSRLGWTAWLGRIGEQREDLILDPQSEAVTAAN